MGRDLVTDDIVAVIELVKNAYDALARSVHVRFVRDPEHGLVLEVLDDGVGMDRHTLEDVWCVVATPFRKENPTVGSGRQRRTVTGDKGLGRLSAARLGRKLELVTRTEQGPCLKIVLDWDAISRSNDLNMGRFELVEIASHRDLPKHGTLIRILELSATWDNDRISDLRDNLARLLSPFAKDTTFSIFLSTADEQEEAPVQIEPPAFLSKPKYAIRGHADADGNVTCRYEYHPISDGAPRQKALTRDWSQLFAALDDTNSLDEASANCGPFEFEIRAWDLRPSDTLEISERFEIRKNLVRQSIKAHKGISLYRDDVLVLPKSDAARDWLGLDLRRVSHVGPRLSTSQLVGYVRISKAANPGIEDTSDRERLASSPTVRAFEAILRSVVNMLEVERSQDRRQPAESQRMTELFEDLTADELLAQMLDLADKGAAVSSAIPELEKFSARLARVRTAIETRFTYYSRLATVGTIAQMIIHEIRNRTTVIGRVLRKLQEAAARSGETSVSQQLTAASAAVTALEQLADRFAPLASRSFRTGRRTSVLEESIQRSLDMLGAQVDEQGVTVVGTPRTVTPVAVDPGELDSIFVNLFANALYWLGRSSDERKLRVRLSAIRGRDRVRVSIDDSGPGVDPDDAERIFWPGVTRKPDGIGMGLTVASELVAEHGGRMALVQPGRLGGATFVFDVPLAAG